MSSLFTTLRTVRSRGVQFSEHLSGDPRMSRRSRMLAVGEAPNRPAFNAVSMACEPDSGPVASRYLTERDQDLVGVSNGIFASGVNAATQVT